MGEIDGIVSGRPYSQRQDLDDTVAFFVSLNGFKKHFQEAGLSEFWAERCFERMLEQNRLPATHAEVARMACDWKRYEDIDGGR